MNPEKLRKNRRVICIVLAGVAVILSVLDCIRVSGMENTQAGGYLIILITSVFFLLGCVVKQKGRTWILLGAVLLALFDVSQGFISPMYRFSTDFLWTCSQILVIAIAVCVLLPLIRKTDPKTSVICFLVLLAIEVLRYLMILIVHPDMGIAVTGNAMTDYLFPYVILQLREVLLGVILFLIALANRKGPKVKVENAVQLAVDEEEEKKKWIQ